MRRSALVLGGAALLTGFAFWVCPGIAGKASVELGRELFNDPSLGNSPNETSCNTCHPNGEGLELAAKRDDLDTLINRCIAGPLQGERLNTLSVEIRSLKMFIQSLDQ